MINDHNTGDALVARLVEIYRRDRVTVARICDEQLDRSGNLLGYLRDAAAIRKEGP
jgi:hypothetical protein